MTPWLTPHRAARAPRVRGAARWLALLCAALAPGLAAAEAPVRVVATIGMIADVVGTVGGPCVAVTTMMGPGVDPHLYQAGAADVRKLQDAEAIFYAGYALEGQLGDVFKRFAETRPTVAVAPASIAPAELISVQDLYGIDPHLWMDASLWAKIAPTIADTLAGLRPGCAEAMRANAASYGAQLAALHGWVKAAIATVPQGQRILVTAHDAFGYYGRAYGIEVAGIQGVSTEAEAAVADVRATVDLVVARRVPTVFVESTINPRTIQAVTEGAQQKGHAVVVGPALYSDAMGAAGTAAGTYIGMIHQNTSNIVTGLGGTVPPLPDGLAGWAAQWGVAAPK